MPGAIPIERGCGTREEGGIYLEIGVSENGLPLEDFILDPPVRVPAELGISPIGVTFIPEILPTGEIIYHVADWIGENNYKNVWDYFAEARLYGSSRRLPKTLDFSKIDHRSRLIPIHPHGIVRNGPAFTGNEQKKHGSWVGREEIGNGVKIVPFGATWAIEKPLYGGWICPKGKTAHEPHHDPCPCCAGIWAQDIEDGEPLTEEERAGFGYGPAYMVDGSANSDHNDPRLVKRVLPSVRYVGRRAPEGVRVIHEPAFIASFPISRLVVVAGHGDADSLTKANKAKIAVNLVQE